MLTRWRGRSEAGSGMTIGVAVIFPMLMLVIVALHMITEAAGVDQSLQATANRAALTASLCCYDTAGARHVVHAGLRAAWSADAHNRVPCINDFVSDSETAFFGVHGGNVELGLNPNDPAPRVPAGGTVDVYLRCVVPARSLGGFALPGIGIERHVHATASIDPYRFRVRAPTGS